jgi:lysyl-tRNA synthetase class II
MTDYSAINNSTEKLFETTLQKINGQLEVRRKDSSVGLKLLERFDELKKYNRVFVHKVTELKGKSGSFIILLVEKR